MQTFKRMAALGLALILFFSVCGGTASAATTADTKSIACGYDFTLALKEDGTVAIAGGSGQTDLKNDLASWSNIVSISSFDRQSFVTYAYAAGLTASGKVVVAGAFSDSSVSSWKNIVAICASEGALTGLKSDGTVISTAYSDVSGWNNIVAIAAGNQHVVGLEANGSVVASGSYGYGQCDVSAWRNIVAIAAGSFHTVGLKADGTVVAVGDNLYGQCNVSSWRNIVAISADESHTVGLKADGTVVAVGSNEDGECNVSSWKNIVAVYAGYNHTVGVKSDGSVVAVGNNDSGQCNVSGWNHISVGTSTASITESSNPYADLSVNSTFEMGYYGSQALRWRVLEKYDDKMLVLCEDGIDSRRYHYTQASVTWATCSLKSWLNDTFYYSAFSGSERDYILTTNVDSVYCKVYLLSTGEVFQYFPTQSSRICRATTYAVSEGAYVNPNTGGSWWLLRTPGEDYLHVASVNSDGTMDYDGGRVESDRGVVRPAMWISLE